MKRKLLAMNLRTRSILTLLVLSLGCSTAIVGIYRRSDAQRTDSEPAVKATPVAEPQSTPEKDAEEMAAVTLLHRNRANLGDPAAIRAALSQLEDISKLRKVEA